MSANLHVIQTGSAANGYILTCGDNRLVLEAGCKTKEYLQALDYNIADVQALVTHRHVDHARSIANLLSYGIPVYSCHDVASLYPQVKVLEPMKKYKIGRFCVLPLRVPHGDCPNYAYHITMPDGHTLLFCTDAQTLPFKLPNVNVLMIEANYMDELIIDQLCEGNDICSHFNAHMELNETIHIIKRLYNPNMHKVVLIHLSSNNSDEQMFKNRIFSETGVMCEIANEGDVYELKEDF